MIKFSLKYLLILAFVSGLNISLSAQDKKLTMDDAILGYHLYPAQLNQLEWVDDYHYAYVSKDRKELYVTQVEETGNGLVRTVLVSDIDSFYTIRYGEASDLKSFGRIHSWISHYEFRIIINKNLYRYHYGDREFELLVSDFNRDHGEYHEKSNSLAYTEDNDVYILAGNETRRVTRDGGEGIVNGEAVHRFEFGIQKGLFWSTDGSKLAFYRMDETMVTEYPLYMLNDTPATSKTIRYPVAGAASHHVKVGVYHRDADKVVMLDVSGPPEQYLTNITWGPEGKIVYVAVVNREQNHMVLQAYDAANGQLVRTLFEEKHEKYVEPEHGPVFTGTSMDQFIWWSERDGYNHLYLYKTDGTLIRQLTRGNWDVLEIEGLNSDATELFVTTTMESPIERHLYCVDLSSGKTKKLTRQEGTHSTILNGPGTHFLDKFSSTVVPGQVSLHTIDGKNLGILHKADNPLEEYSTGRMEIGTIKADDGTPLYYRVVYPVNFDAKKKYPVIVYLYNGPHVQLVRNTWMGGANLWYQYLAQQGFVVFTIDGRGSANRGLAFENAIFRNLGDLEMKDQLAGVDWLRNKAWVDTARMGVHGWSYGGFMTTSLMTRYPGVFKVGVAGGPVIDWKFYEVMYTERYMDTPQENPEGYDKANLTGYVADLRGKLLIIHGAQDPVVLWQQSLLFLNAAIDQQVQVDYFVYPEHEHNVYGKARVHLYRKVTDYLVDGLKD